MVQFPETAATEWKIVADAANADKRLKAKLAEDTQVEQELIKLRLRHRAAQMLAAEIEAEDTPDLVMMSLADYRANPGSMAPTDLIEGVLNDDSVCVVLGPGGSGKSTLALQMIHSLATGEDFLDQSVTQMTGGFGVMSYDMPGGLMLDWMDGYPNVDANRFSIVDAHKRGNPLAVPDQRAAIVKHWQKMNVEVVVVDSFSASFFGHDQNDATAVQAHYRELKKFALSEVGAKAVIIIVHSTAGSPLKPRGSTVHIDAADTMMAVWSPTGPLGTRHVEMTKYRTARGQTMMDPRIIGSPDPVTHLVEIDAGGMTLADMTLPPRLGAAAFDTIDVHEAPDTDSDSELESDEDL